jgi:hypothetical protein
MKQLLSRVQAVFAGLLFLLACPLAAPAEESSLSEQDVPSLAQADIPGAIKRSDCVIMYYTSDRSENDADARKVYGQSGQRLADEWMRALLAFQRQEALNVKLYKVNWKGMSPDTINRIRFDAGSLYPAPESPTFISYIDGGAGKFAIPGPARPDRLSWFVNEMLSHTIATVRTPRGEFMRGPGWSYTDTKARYIGLIGMRKGPLPVPGGEQEVQVLSYESSLFNGSQCSYESFYSRTGALIGIVEACAKDAGTGYFDLDRSGRLQYRVRFRQDGSLPTSGTQPASPAK